MRIHFTVGVAGSESDCERILLLSRVLSREIAVTDGVSPQREIRIEVFASPREKDPPDVQTAHGRSTLIPADDVTDSLYVNGHLAEMRAVSGPRAHERSW